MLLFLTKALKYCKVAKFRQIVSHCLTQCLSNLFFKWANPCLFFIYFCLFKHKLQFLQQINVKK